MMLILFMQKSSHPMMVSVIITWWERNATVNEPVAKVSTDNGLTFGPVLNLANNGPIANIDIGEE